MRTAGYTLFDTPIGRCGIAWGAGGVTCLQLPERKETETRARLRARRPDAAPASPPPEVDRAIAAIRALLAGDAADLAAIALDMDGVPAFHRRVYEAARTVPPGATRSYGEIAAAAGAPGAARAVGQALGRNPFAIIVPCHRVLAAGGRVGGFSADGGIGTKLRLLALEQAHAARADGPALPYDADAAVAALRAADPALARLIDAVGPYRLTLQTTPSVFVALAQAIVYQQLTARAAGTIFARLCALFPRGHEGPTAPGLLRLPDARLRAAGLSRPKLLALRDLARRAVARQIPTLAQAHAMDDAALIEALTAVRGIGRWSVEMLLIFRLGRPDVLPTDDYALRKGFQRTFRTRALPTAADVARRGARWAPWRSVASWYLWRAAEAAPARRTA